MSFGFSIGDFIAAVTLIRNVISALNGTAASECRDLELELHGLQRALYEIEHLTPLPGQEAEVNAVKVAALMCQYPLQDFESRLRKYERISQSGHSRKRDVVKDWGRKAEWNFSMPDEVQKLRAYIAGHTGSLNMRLTTLGLATMGVTIAKAEQAEGLLQSSLENQATVVGENARKLESLSTLVARRVIPQLQSLVELATKVWDSNMQIMNYFSKIQSTSLGIDTRHTWFQDPLKLEDVFGRFMPIPAEYGWSTIHAVIRDRFASGPGHEKVQAGEYELFITEDSSQLITEETASLLKPGSGVTMAMLVGMYYFKKDICPKPGCMSKSLVNSAAGGMICKCKTWFGVSTRHLPRPFRWFGFEKLEKDSSDRLSTRRKRKRLTKSTMSQNQNLFREMREERKWFKNLLIQQSGLSTVGNIIDLHWQVKNAPHLKRVKVDVGDDANMSTNPNEVSCRISQGFTTSTNVTDLWKSVSKIITQEMCVGLDELQDTSLFTDYGWDSLLLLCINHRLRRDLSLDIPISDLMSCATIGQLRMFVETGRLSTRATEQ